MTGDNLCELPLGGTIPILCLIPVCMIIWSTCVAGVILCATHLGKRVPRPSRQKGHHLSACGSTWEVCVRRV